MKPAHKIISTFLGLLIVCAWSLKQSGNFKKAEWLIGTWENRTEKGTIYETWTRLNPTEFSGKSYIIKENDTIIFEKIRLIENNDGIFYIPTVTDQNDARPVWFRCKSISGHAMLFENQQHDFPQLISYTKIAEDSLLAEISGSIKGKDRRQTFPMKRVEK